MPDAEVAYAHGQMSERELERVMYQFMNGEVDVLVSTTIIETGLDIGNVNTMIIHDADQSGTIPVVPAARKDWTFQPDSLCVPDVPKKIRC